MIVINCLKTRENKKQGYHKETRDVKIIQYKNILLHHFKEIKIKVDFTNTPLPLKCPLHTNILTDLAGFFLVVAF